MALNEELGWGLTSVCGGGQTGVCVLHTHSQGMTSWNCDGAERRTGAGADWCVCVCVSVSVSVLDTHNQGVTSRNCDGTECAAGIGVGLSPPHGHDSCP